MTVDTRQISVTIAAASLGVSIALLPSYDNVPADRNAVVALVMYPPLPIQFQPIATLESHTSFRHADGQISPVC